LVSPKYGEFGSSLDKFAIFLGGQNPEGRFGRIIFGILYVSFNVVMGIKWFNDAEAGSEKARNVGPEQMFNFTVWVPVAKFFGVIMDINFTIIFIPVSRLFIRWLYERSTGSHTMKSSIFKSVLYIFPLDYALEFHMLCGIIGYFCAVMHTFAHIMNFATKAEEVWSKFGWWIWFSGIGLLFCLTILVSAVHRNVRRNHFNIFYYTHLMYIPITILNIFHGANFMGPNFWKFLLLGPGPIFLFERIYRYYISSIPVSLIDFTNMGVVTTISLGKEAFLHGYKEGHYAFINCPHVSKYDWHPFTISSAPQEPYITFHMRVQGEGSWTKRVKEYLTLLTPPGKSSMELWHHDTVAGVRVKGNSTGPDGKPYFHLYGPCSAPTQHLGEYDEVMICASGIGVTPLASSMKSIVFHKWKTFVGRCFPDRAHFFWVCSHRDVKSFRWFVRTIKEAEDAVVDLTQKK